jgi:hypothetical protein
MSHPNPCLFQISRMIMHVRSRMDAATSVGSYPMPDDVDLQGCIHYVLGKLRCNLLYERMLLYKHSFEVLLL